MIHPIRSGVAIAVALLGCACAPHTTQPNVNLGGYPPAFRAGYVDGCDSARRTSSPTRDEARFRSDSMYAAGWRDGFDICSKQKK